MSTNTPSSASENLVVNTELINKGAPADSEVRRQIIQTVVDDLKRGYPEFQVIS